MTQDEIEKACAELSHWFGGGWRADMFPGRCPGFGGALYRFRSRDAAIDGACFEATTHEWRGFVRSGGFVRARSIQLLSIKVCEGIERQARAVEAEAQRLRAIAGKINRLALDRLDNPINRA